MSIPDILGNLQGHVHVAILFCKGKKITCLFSENNDLSKKRLKKGNTNYHLEKKPPDILQKRVFLKISQYSQENACVGVFLIKLQDWRSFLMEFVKFLRTPVLKNICERCKFGLE